MVGIKESLIELLMKSRVGIKELLIELLMNGRYKGIALRIIDEE